MLFHLSTQTAIIVKRLHIQFGIFSRIEDIVAHTLIGENEQVFFSGNYQERIQSPVITTGNELVKEQIADFSRQLNLKELYSYIFEVKESTEKIINSLSYNELKKKISEKEKNA